MSKKLILPLDHFSATINVSTQDDCDELLTYLHENGYNSRAPEPYDTLLKLNPFLNYGSELCIEIIDGIKFINYNLRNRFDEDTVVDYKGLKEYYICKLCKEYPDCDFCEYLATCIKAQHGAFL